MICLSTVPLDKCFAPEFQEITQWQLCKTENMGYYLTFENND